MPAHRVRAAGTFVGVDVGSTHIKAVLAAPGSGVLHVARRPTETHLVRGGGAYHRPAELLAAVSAAIAECVAAADGPGGKPAAIGIASRILIVLTTFGTWRSHRSTSHYRRN